MIGAIERLLKRRFRLGSIRVPLEDRPLPYSWILTNQLAIGPMPLSESHWNQLERAGFKSRFNCCYPQEDAGLVKPTGLISERVSLPDHRNQESLQLEALLMALDRAEQLVDEHGPVYLHCLAGRERSALLAVGLTARLRDIDMFGALNWVRRCHPMANPVYSHLDLLDTILRSENP